MSCVLVRCRSALLFSGCSILAALHGRAYRLTLVLVVMILQRPRLPRYVIRRRLTSRGRVGLGRYDQSARAALEGPPIGFSVTVRLTGLSADVQYPLYGQI